MTKKESLVLLYLLWFKFIRKWVAVPDSLCKLDEYILSGKFTCRLHNADQFWLCVYNFRTKWALSTHSFHSPHTTLPQTNESLVFITALIACHQPIFQDILTHCNSVYFLSTKWVKGTVEFMKIADIENNLFPWLHIFLPLSFWRILSQLNSLFSSKPPNNFSNYSLSLMYLLIRTYIAF